MSQDNKSQAERRGAVMGNDARLVGMTWTHMINDGATNYLPGVLPAVLIDAHEPLSLAGSLIAALAIGQALQPLIGWVSDRVGGRSILITGFAMTTVGGALLGETHSLAILIVLLLAIGIGTSLFHPQALAAVRSITNNRRGLRTSFFLVGGELGRGLWPTLASLIVVHLGLGYLWIIGIPGVLTIGFLFRLVPSLTPKRSTTIAKSKTPLSQRVGPLSMLIVYTGLRAFGIFGLVTFIPVLWHVRGESLVAGASVITTILVVGIVGNLGGGHLTDLFGRRAVLVGSAIAVAVLIVPMGYVQGFGVWIIASVLGCVLFMTLSTTILVGQDIYPENPSLGSGIALGLSNAIGAVIVLLIGLFIGRADVHVAFIAMGVASLLSVAPALAFPATLMRQDHHQAH